MNNVPAFSLTQQNQSLKKELNKTVNEVIDSGMFILGKNVESFEEEIAKYCGSKLGIGVANGSDALYLALLASGVGPGDEVITTPFTFFATAGSVQRVGARPVFVDIDPETYNINPYLIEKKITTRTKAIIPVHMYGCPADMGYIMELASKYHLKVIEDTAQALGAKYKGKVVGAIGDAGCISFFPTKNLGAFGDGGMVITSSEEIAEKVRLLRVHGAKPRYYHHIIGCNSRLDELQAAILRVKLPYLEMWNELRQNVARLYNMFLEGFNKLGHEVIKLPIEPAYAYHVYHQFTVRFSRRDELRAFLKEKGIGTSVYYPLPLHVQQAFTHLGYRQGDFPETEAACREVLSLPMFPELTEEEIRYIADQLLKFFEEKVQ